MVKQGEDTSSSGRQNANKKDDPRVGNGRITRRDKERRRMCQASHEFAREKVVASRILGVDLREFMGLASRNASLENRLVFVPLKPYLRIAGRVPDNEEAEKCKVGDAHAAA
ncbi:hypothetical protein CYMTET_23858 [Cymbomonas tetramitiformis]|uniref:Uncharacterized protein n=1 Tax=Cymbomonas tetramitiformis TaxID=36881 RepID=A0AAE0FXD0_9CHLO|nr:hypothetical protein CYMTET_23858 [Cymbomonas tetramitiformis]